MIKYWLTGIIISGLGLILARLVPSLLTQPVYKVIAYLIGTALAFTGLVVIVFGMRRKSQSQKHKEVI
jgi:hypothetical protein